MPEAVGYAKRNLTAKALVGQRRSASTQPLPKRGRSPTGQRRVCRLSQVLVDHPGACDGLKLSLVERGVGSIDPVPEEFRRVETLFLSSNSLPSLAGVEQFAALRVLSCANNGLATFEALDPLRQLKALAILNLEYNPVSQLPNYRFHVLHRVPALRNLDNREVTRVERQGCEAALQKEARMLDMMHSNYCLIRKLEMGLQKVQLHDELRAAVMARRRGPDGSVRDCFDLQVFLKLCNENFMMHEDQEWTVMLLRKAIRRARNVKLFTMGKLIADAAGGGPAAIVAAGDSWDAYFGEVLQQQQTEVAELLTRIEAYCGQRQPFDMLDLHRPTALASPPDADPAPPIPAVGAQPRRRRPVRSPSAGPPGSAAKAKAAPAAPSPATEGERPRPPQRGRSVPPAVQCSRDSPDKTPEPRQPQPRPTNQRHVPKPGPGGWPASRIPQYVSTSDATQGPCPTPRGDWAAVIASLPRFDAVEVEPAPEPDAVASSSASLKVVEEAAVASIPNAPVDIAGTLRRSETSPISGGHPPSNPGRSGTQEDAVVTLATLRDAFTRWRAAWLWETVQAEHRWAVAAHHHSRTLLGQTFQAWRRYLAQYCQDLQRRLAHFRSHHSTLPARLPGTPPRSPRPSRPMGTPPVARSPDPAPVVGSSWLPPGLARGAEEQRLAMAVAYAQQTEQRWLHQCLRAWRKFTFISKRHTRSKQLLAAFTVQRCRSCLCRAFSVWRQRWQARCYLREMERGLVLRRECAVRRRAFGHWVALHAHRSWVEARALHRQVRTLQQALEEQQRSRTGEDIDRVRLVDRVQQLTREKTRLAAEAKEVRAEAQRLAAALEEHTLVQAALRQEAHSHQLRAAEAEAGAARLRDQLAASQDDQGVLHAQHLLLASRYEQRVQTLTAAMRLAQRQLEAVQGEAQGLRQGQEASSAEATSKLSTALQIAASLRQMVDQTDWEMRELAAAKLQQQQRLGDCEQQLRATTGRLAHALDQRDRTIDALRQEVSALQAQAAAGAAEAATLRHALAERGDAVLYPPSQQAVPAASGRTEANAGLSHSAISAPALSPPKLDDTASSSSTGVSEAALPVDPPAPAPQPPPSAASAPAAPTALVQPVPCTAFPPELPHPEMESTVATATGNPPSRSHPPVAALSASDPSTTPPGLPLTPPLREYWAAAPPPTPPGDGPAAGAAWSRDVARSGLAASYWSVHLPATSLPPFGATGTVTVPSPGASVQRSPFPPAPAEAYTAVNDRIRALERSLAARLGLQP
eukprot:EG_transcript_592